MNEQERDRRVEGAETLEPFEARKPWRRGRFRDLVLDLSGVGDIDAANLTLLLTAQQHARSEGRSVWLAGTSAKIWETIVAMGLGRFFKRFPAPYKGAV
jgi:anti-anti-sigma regulatory factor